LKDVLDLAGGFNDPIFRKSIRDDNILVLRRDENQYYSLEFNVSYDESDKFKLIPDDQIFVYENTQYTNRFSVKIGGEVNKKGTYQFREKMTVQDVIDLADGLTLMANKDAIIVSQSFSSIDENGNDIITEKQISDAQLDFQVPSGATVNVLPLENVVEVQGNVYNPGLIKYTRGYRYPRYIELAGGYKPNSLKRKAYIRRANGNIEKVNGFFISRGKRVYAGDSIIVPENLDPTDFNIQSLLTDALSVLTNLVAILAIIDNTSD
jgi:protein involved in polysaccharide export with SLBB domain